MNDLQQQKPLNGSPNRELPFLSTDRSRQLNRPNHGTNSSFLFFKARTQKRSPQRRSVLFNIRAIRDSSTWWHYRPSNGSKARTTERQLHPIPKGDEINRIYIISRYNTNKILKKSPQLHTRSILFLRDNIKKKKKLQGVCSSYYVIYEETSIKNIFIHNHEIGNWPRRHERNKFVVIIHGWGVVESISEIIEGSFSRGWPSSIYGTLYSS